MQNNKEIIKKKNDLFKSIMSNPKLSRAFKEAVNAPIGSTKRAQAKSVLSIMKKMSGISNDGTGGPMPMIQQPAHAPTPAPTTPNYGNIMIFPAAPKLKSTKKQGQAPAQNDGQGGPVNTSNMNGWMPSISTVSANSTPSMINLNPTPRVSTDWSNNLQSKAPAFDLGTSSQSMSTSMSDTTPSTIGKATTPTPPPAATNWNINAPFSQANWENGAPVYNVPAAGKLPTGVTGTPTPSAPGETSSSSSTGSAYSSPTYTAPTSGNATLDQAVRSGKGAIPFAMDFADAKFGGGIDQYIANLDSKLKKDFNLEPLEQELTNLKSQSGNLIPTLTSYIEGRDQYLSFIDSMISKTEGSLLKRDMGNPAVAASYEKYLTYLYTLKGRQATRYGNYLNGAVADYEAKVNQVQSTYENAYKHYETALNQQGTIAQNQYNNTMAYMSAAYTELENAPTRLMNAAILKDQYNKLNASTISGGLNQDTVLNPDFIKDQAEYIKAFSDKDGGLSEAAIGSTGLIGNFEQVVGSMQRSPEPLIAAYSQMIQKSIENAGGTDSTETKQQAISRIKKTIDQLAASSDTGATFASFLYPALSKGGGKEVTSYVQSNLSKIKNAATDLVSGQSTKSLLNPFSWLNSKTATGLANKEAWKARHTELDSGLLDSLYEHAQKTITPESAYAKNPSAYISDLFLGPDDYSQAQHASGILL